MVMTLQGGHQHDGRSKAQRVEAQAMRGLILQGGRQPDGSPEAQRVEAQVTRG